MPEQTEQTPQAAPAQPVGMTESSTCGLAYLTCIPAIIFLVSAPYNQNPKIRFHAWQCIFLSIGWIASSVILVVPFIGWLIGFVLFIGIAVMWLIAMINAFGGKMFRLPIIGGLAAKQAGMA
ncbi:MAG TPA: hypothetical protein VGJ21_00970 [Terracidiphilus sp.]|jgi:uncharacterized membrane protein